MNDARGREYTSVFSLQKEKKKMKMKEKKK